MNQTITAEQPGLEQQRRGHGQAGVGHLASPTRGVKGRGQEDQEQNLGDGGVRGRHAEVDPAPRSGAD